MVRQTTHTKKIIADALKSNQQKVIDFLTAQSAVAPTPFYSSVDLRDSGYKIAPVDNNLYPAGWNNICPEDQRNAPAVFRAQIECKSQILEKNSPCKILILPETHTKNQGYLENLFALSDILTRAEFDVKLGWLGESPLTQDLSSFDIQTETGKSLTYHPIVLKEKSGKSVVSTQSGFVPDLILLNNDFSTGYPIWLDQVSQPIVPPHFLGWHSRKKSEHFFHYNRLAKNFAEAISIDPWLIQISSEEVTPINFSTGEGFDHLKQTCASMLDQLITKHREHHISTPPFLFIKNNSGTYGMGIMTIHSIEELESMNRRTKNKMSVGKGHQIISSVVVQEGIPTSTIVDKIAAEPVIYLAGCALVGGFLRTNTQRGREDNLNSQGMVFRKLCMSDLSSGGDPGFDEALLEQIYGGRVNGEPTEEPILELVYGSIARISSLATGLEIQMAEKSILR